MKSVNTSVNNELEHLACENSLWRAVLYVLGEGTAEDRAHFEDQLGFDEALCEALVEATQLIELATMGLKTSRLSHQPAFTVQEQVIHRVSRRPGTAIVGTAAAVLFALCLTGAPSSESLSDAELVTQMLHNAAAEEDSEVDSSMNEWSGDIDTPQWLLTALELEEADSTIDETPPIPDDSI